MGVIGHFSDLSFQHVTTKTSAYLGKFGLFRKKFFEKIYPTPVGWGRYVNTCIRLGENKLHEQKKGNNAHGLNIWFTLFCHNFKFVVIFEFFSHQLCIPKIWEFKKKSKSDLCRADMFIPLWGRFVNTCVGKICEYMCREIS